MPQYCVAERRDVRGRTRTRVVESILEKTDVRLEPCRGGPDFEDGSLLSSRNSPLREARQGARPFAGAAPAVNAGTQQSGVLARAKVHVSLLAAAAAAAAAAAGRLRVVACCGGHRRRCFIRHRLRQHHDYRRRRQRRQVLWGAVQELIATWPGQHLFSVWAVHVGRAKLDETTVASDRRHSRRELRCRTRRCVRTANE